MPKFAFILFTVFLLSLAVVAPTFAEAPSRPANGGFDMQGYFCAEAGAGLCATGIATGTISGDIFVAIDTLVLDPVTFVQYYTGRITITSQNGAFYGTISNGSLTPTSQTTVALSSTVNFTSGTGFYTNRRATLSITGGIDLLTFREIDSYSGTIQVAPNS